MKSSSSAPNEQGCSEPLGTSELDSSSSRTPTSTSSSCKYKGVRKRKWGKYVSEIRLPNCRDRIWLGSYDTAEKAARAFDAALYCLRGRNAKFNFPDDPPEIPNGGSMTPAEIQEAASRFARAEPGPRAGRVDSRSDSFSSRAESLSGSEFTGMPLDNAFSYDQFLGVDTQGGNAVPDYGLFPGFDDDYSGEFLQPNTTTSTSPDYNYWQDNHDELSNQSSFLWNFN